jgi:hypothetical protein
MTGKAQTFSLTSFPLTIQESKVKGREKGKERGREGGASSQPSQSKFKDLKSLLTSGNRSDGLLDNAPEKHSTIFSKFDKLPAPR